MYLGIEIGGTKLQLGVGPDDGQLRARWRGTVDVAAGPEGIRRQIVAAVPEVLGRAGVERGSLRGVGIGFGGPVDDATQTVIKSHQIAGWDGFPLADWVSEMVSLPAALGNDADVAGLAEALHGAGKGLSPIFYVTIGSGIGGGFIIDEEIYRGVGRGAAEIGHLVGGWYDDNPYTIESAISGWALERRFGRPLPEVADQARRGDRSAWSALSVLHRYLADALCNVIVLLCPRRFILGGGVSLLGEELLFEPVRQIVAQRVFPPFAGLTDIVPAALGEEVVVHGAIALARKKLA